MFIIILTITVTVISGVTFMLAVGSHDDSSEIAKLKAHVQYLRIQASKPGEDLRDLRMTYEKKFNEFTAAIMAEIQKMDKKTESTFVAAKKEIETLIVRQRTLEKKLLAQGDRTVNLVIQDSKDKKLIGRGKSALFPGEQK